MVSYSLIAVRAAGIILLSHPKFGQQMWTLVKCRKHKRCVITDVDLYKQEAFAPVTNGYNRMHRISPVGMHIIIGTD